MITSEYVNIPLSDRGVIESAMTKELRDSFLRNRSRKAAASYSGDYDEMSEYIASDECVHDLKKLLDRNYTMPPPFHKCIPKNMSGAKRDIYIWKGSVKYLFQLIAFASRKYDSMYSDGLYSFRTSRTARDFLLRILNFENTADYYIVKADVSNYVSSIVPELIIPKLEELLSDDPAFLDLTKYLLLRRECIESDGSIVSCEPGGMGGIPLANMFMNVYLMELDDYFYERSPLYCRYSDDIVIFARSRDEAETYKEYLLKVLESKKLSSNREKTYLIPPGEEVEILGFKYRGGEMDISDHAKAKIKRKIRMHARRQLQIKREMNLSDEECARNMIRYCRSIFFGIRGGNDLTWARWLFPVITTTESLREIDHYVQNAIRYVMCGSFSGKRYRITYKELQDLGYRSIVHAYYHFEHLD